MSKLVEDYLKELNTNKEHIENFKNNMESMFGISGKMPDTIALTPEMKKEFDDIVLEVPEGLDEKTVMAVFIGAFMNPERMKDDISTSTPSGDMLEMNWSHVVQDVPDGDKRMAYFSPILLEAKKEARQALKEFAENKPEKVKQYMQFFFDGTSPNVAGMNPGARPDTVQAFGLLYDELLEKNQFGLFPKAPGHNEITGIVAQSVVNQFKVSLAAEDKRRKLVVDADKLSPEEKGSLAEEVIFAHMVKSMMSRQATLRSNKSDDYLADAARRLGLDNAENFGASLDPAIHKLRIANREFMKIHEISDFDVIMSKPDGVQRLKELYLPVIRESEEYKKLVDATTSDEMVDGMNDVDVNLRKGIDRFKDVKLPNESKPINDKYKDIVEKENKRYANAALEGAFQSDEHYLDKADGKAIERLDPASMKKNAKLIDDMYKLIDGNNTWGGSKNNNYKNMLDKLKKLKGMADKFAKTGSYLSEADARNYTKLAKEVDALAEKYLDNKKDINSPYAKARVKGVKELRRNLIPNVAFMDSAINEMKKEKTAELFSERFGAYDELDQLGRLSPFHRAPAKRKITFNKGYHLKRSAGETVGILAMLASGEYSFEDIMDPTKLTKEKEKLYDEISTKMIRQQPADQKDIAKIMYDGMRAGEKIMNDKLAGIDFNDPDLFKNKDFARLMRLQYHLSDCDQEMANCKNEITEYAKTKDPNVKKYTDIKPVWTPLSDIVGVVETMKDAGIKSVTAQSDLSEHLSHVLGGSIVIENCLHSLGKAMAEKGDKLITEYYDQAKRNELALTNASVDEAVESKLRFMKNDPKLARDITTKFADGSLAKSVTAKMDFEKGKVILNGFPTEEKIKMEAENVRFLKKTDAAIERLETKTYTKTSEYLKDSAYALFGQLYRNAGGNPPIDEKTGKEMTLEAYSKKMIKNPMFLETLKSKISPGKFANPKSIADLVKDPVSMKNLIKKSAKQHQELQKAKEMKRAPKKAQVKKNDPPQNSMNNAK